MSQSIEWVPWDGKGKAIVRRGPHAFTRRILHWAYCSKCGLVLLKNDVSRRAAKQQCEWMEDA